MHRIEPHALHRVALAAEDLGPVKEWFARVLGSSAPNTLAGLNDPSDGDAGAGMLWSCGHPFVLLSGGIVARYLERRGPGVQSIAWEVDDNWTTENAVRARGIEVISHNFAGRFFFMHPSQTSGLLIEWCDGWMERAGPRPEILPGLVESPQLAWITGVVTDVDATLAWVQDLVDVHEVDGNAKGDESLERTVDLAVGNTTVRLVSAISPQSRYAEASPGWHSFAIRVPDLDTALGQLKADGADTIARDGALATTDPSGTVGLRIDWTE
jgi:hypothetical protein